VFLCSKAIETPMHCFSDVLKFICWWSVSLKADHLENFEGSHVNNAWLDHVYAFVKIDDIAIEVLDSWSIFNLCMYFIQGCVLASPYFYLFCTSLLYLIINKSEIFRNDKQLNAICSSVVSSIKNRQLPPPPKHTKKVQHFPTIKLGNHLEKTSELE